MHLAEYFRLPSVWQRSCFDAITPTTHICVVVYNGEEEGEKETSECFY